VLRLAPGAANDLRIPPGTAARGTGAPSPGVLNESDGSSEVALGNPDAAVPAATTGLGTIRNDAGPPPPTAPVALAADGLRNALPAEVSATRVGVASEVAAEGPVGVAVRTDVAAPGVGVHAVAPAPTPSGRSAGEVAVGRGAAPRVGDRCTSAGAVTCPGGVHPPRGTFTGRRLTDEPTGVARPPTTAVPEARGSPASPRRIVVSAVSAEDRGGIADDGPTGPAAPVTPFPVARGTPDPVALRTPAPVVRGTRPASVADTSAGADPDAVTADLPWNSPVGADASSDDGAGRSPPVTSGGSGRAAARSS